MNSVWKDNSERKGFPAMDGDKRTDVLIIGGGMAGILCAYMLKRKGVDCILVEADKICNGVTANTTAKITFLSSPNVSLFSIPCILSSSR